MARNVVDYLKSSVERYPEKIVCADDDEQLTYQELWDGSHRISGNIMSDVKTLTPIPVLMKKSCKAFSVIWGIIKAGNSYVMIDPMLPKERIFAILETLDATVVIIEDEKVKTKLPENVQVISYQMLQSEISQSQINKVANRMESICDIDPLYIMFTSGSTGVPKGVVVNHRSVVDFIDYFVEIFEITSDEVIGNQAPWDFDVSVKDIFSTIKAGATIQFISKKYFSLPMQLAELLENKHVTTLIWAVSALCILSSRGIFEKVVPSKIKKVIFSGEVMPIAQYNIWKRVYPNAMFVNVYGPTEITCNCTYCILDREYGEDEVLPIGKAFPNKRVFLLNEQEQLITVDMTETVGEICVSGTSVSSGYYNANQETKTHFVQNPLNNKYNEIIYKTGDLAFYNINGELCFVGRKDFQIKHLGHRIELSEIERALYLQNQVKQACCLFHNEEIIAFIGSNNDDRKMIIAELRKKLPQYMIPSKIYILPELRLNKNGKIDRKLLVDYLEEANDK